MMPESTDAAPKVVDGLPLTDDDRRLKASMELSELQQADRLDTTAYLFIKLSAALFAVVSLVAAFAEPFRLSAGSLRLNILVLGALCCYVGALLAGLLTVLPRAYKRYDYNVTRAREELQRMVTAKLGALWTAGLLFFCASCLQALVIGLLLLGPGR